MSKISKALDKYKKEHNLTSSQIYNLEDSQADKESPSLKHPKWSLNYDARPTVTPDPAQKPAHVIKPTLEQGKNATPAVSNETAKAVDKTPDLEPAVPPETLGGFRQPNRFTPNLVSIVNPSCAEAELFKVLRGKILFPTTGKPPQSIIVTSAAPGDGKSFIASNLSATLALSIENHVLLVDCDIRRPTIHRLFGFGKVKGLSEHLSYGNKLTSLLLETGIDKLTILPSGKPPANPSELLSSDKMAALIEDLKKRYDNRFLIIDSPPPTLAPETVAMAKHVDGILVVIKYGSTPVHLVEELIENLGREKIIGAVINRFDSRISTKYYGYTKYLKYYRTES